MRGRSEAEFARGPLERRPASPSRHPLPRPRPADLPAGTHNRTLCQVPPLPNELASGRKDKGGIGHNVVVRRKQAPTSQGRGRGRGCREGRPIGTGAVGGVFSSRLIICKTARDLDEVISKLFRRFTITTQPHMLRFQPPKEFKDFAFSFTR